jgi:hypothetical protein
MIALITGASMGIGKHISLELAKRGYDLILTSRNNELLEQLQEECIHTTGVRVYVYPLDLAAPGSAYTLYDWTVQQKLKVDVLINNAGFGDYGSFYASSYDKVSEMIQVNVSSLTQLTRLFLPNMVQQAQGYVMNVASVAGFVPGPYMAVYYATKAYVLSFSEAIAEEVRGTGVIVSAFCPGATETAFFDRAAAGNNPLFKKIPMPKASEVGAYGVKALFKGKIVSVHGVMNQANVFMLRWIPRRFLVKMLAKFQKSR